MALSPLSDLEIITLYKDGDKNAFKELVDRYTTSLYNFARHFVDQTNAPDIVQETFIKAWKHLSRFDSTKASFKTWLFTILKNTITDFLRKKKSIVFSDMEKEDDEGEIISFSETILDEDTMPDEVLQKLEDKEFLRRTLDTLKPHDRQVLILHYQEDLTFEEISSILQKPLNTVKSINRRAIIALRKTLEP